jgi:hypothetical protein
MDRMFRTVEVMELILEYLPIQQLLFLSAVCKQWQAVILGSPPLQRALFFRPLGAAVRAATTPAGLALFRRDRDPSAVVGGARDTVAVRVMRNPFERHIFHLARQRQLPFHAAASWRRMLTSQPPVALAHSNMLGVVRDPAGVRFHAWLATKSGARGLASNVVRHPSDLTEWWAWESAPEFPADVKWIEYRVKGGGGGAGDGGGG